MSITQEQNYQRKSHRITIPIIVSIDNENFNVKDWSTTGLKIEDRDSILASKIKLKDEIEAKLILPTGKSSVMLDLTITFVNLKHMGFEITDMLEKNRRVLRHYATLAIEGNGQKIEDLTSDLLMVNVQTPIKEPLALTKDESEMVNKAFKKKSLIYVVSGVILFFLIIATIFYNYAVVYNSIGIITGNTQKYMAAQKGILKNVYVKKDSKIKKGKLLYNIDDEDEKYLLKVENERLSSLKYKLLLNKKVYAKEKKRINKLTANSYNVVKKPTIDEYTEQVKLYERSKKLYEKRLITMAHYNQATKKYLLFMQGYTNQNIAIKKDKLELENDKLSIIKLNEYNINKAIERSKLKIENIKRILKSYFAIATEDGRVHSLKYKEGNFIDYGDNILIAEVDKKPYVLVKILSKDALNINISQSCIIYINGKKYKGFVSGIGYSVTDTNTNMTIEISQNEVPIRIEFEDESIRLSLNQRVEVWILRNSNILENIFF